MGERLGFGLTPEEMGIETKKEKEIDGRILETASKMTSIGEELDKLNQEGGVFSPNPMTKESESRYKELLVEKKKLEKDMAMMLRMRRELEK